MFHVSKSLDELVQILEGTHGAPLSANCMIPRQRVLELLDGLRDTFLTELGGTWDVLDQRNGTINSARTRTSNTISSTGEETHHIVDEAEVRANRAVENANAHAAGTVATAEDDARHLREDAQRGYNNIVDRASVGSDRLIRAGNESCEHSVAEDRKEQARLVVESAVVRGANDEAGRLLSDAHADSSRLYEECDRYVDFRFAEFEQTLQETLHNIGRSRSALRSDAGVTGGGAGVQNVPSSFPDDQGRRQYERQGIFGVD